MSDYSDEFQSRSSDEDYIENEYKIKPAQTRERSNRLKPEKQKSYKEIDKSDDDDFYDSEIDQEQQPSDQEEIENGGIFCPDIDIILWKKDDKYLVKYKGHSYLRVEYITEEELISQAKGIKNKLSRFLKNFEQKQQEEDCQAFDPSNLEIDRVINHTDLFSVIHPKKANEIKGKYYESLQIVILKLLNFYKDDICYGVQFMEPVDPERQNIPNYRKIITEPMDLGTILNRLYLGHYTKSSKFWEDLGLVFRNCRKFNKNQNSDIRILGDTLREASIILYKQWYNTQLQKYESLLKIKNQDSQKQNETQENQMIIEKQPHFIIKQKDQINNEENDLPDKIDLSNIDFTGFKNSLQQNLSTEQQQALEQLQQDQLLNGCIRTELPINNQAEEVLQIENYNPGKYSFYWLQDNQSDVIDDLNHKFLSDQEIQQLDLKIEVDKLYYVKWQNQTYMEATWEKESIIQVPEKIQEFKNNNRAIDRDSRKNIIDQSKRHQSLLQYHQFPVKKAKVSHNFLAELENKLFHYNHQGKTPVLYQQKTQPVYKDRRLLRDYQLLSLNWLINAFYQKKNVILADEMGLGKTIQTIAFLNHLVNFENYRGPFLVIAPLSTLGHWKRTCREWTNLNAILYYDLNSIEGRKELRYYEWFYKDISMKGAVLEGKDVYKFQILITSYEVFLQDFNQIFINVPFQYIVVDEAHRLKNQNAKILQQLKRLICKRVLLLTGTPIQNNTDELWTLLNFIEPKIFSSIEVFKREFADLQSQEQLDKLHNLLKPYLLRRMKEDVEDSIPPLQETIIDVEMTTIQKQLYRAIYEKNKAILTRDFCNVNFNTSLNNLEIQLRKICNHPLLINEFEQQLTKDCVTQQEYLYQIVQNSGKMIFLDKFLQKMKSENKKVLIFSQFVNMLNILEEYLKINDYKYEKLDGTVKSKDRQSSIDRFNQVEKKRDVFLLSTKAGGIGINLTAANVVIIFDSDWNPQNDVQATARAHRIGQTQDVKVYRLITCNTYEAHMFERASKKLGLDQAIFHGGAFQNQEEDKNKKLSKEEIEVLLKKGILGFFEDNSKKEESFKEDNIEQILEKNSRIAKYSLIGNSYTVSKSRFVSEQSDTKINIDDPNFWQNVLKSKVSQGQKLLEQSKTMNTKIFQEQLDFMEKLNSIVGNVVETKLNIEGYSADEETIAIKLCQFVQASKNFEKQYKDLAFQWQIDIERPSRRFKKFNPQDLQLNNMSQQQLKTNKNNDDDIFNDSQKNDSDQSMDDNQIKLSQNEQFDLLKRMCSVCQQQNCTLFCQSYCKKSFHQQCKNQPENSLSNNKPDIITDKDKLRKSIQNFTCNDCQNGQTICFRCKKKDSIGISLNKCGTSKCHKYYHLDCLKNQSNIHYVDKQKTKIRCSLHYCQICSQNGENVQLYSCLLCPNAFHFKCIPNTQVIKTGKKQIICHNHQDYFNNKIQINLKDTKKIEKKVKIEKNEISNILENNDDIIDMKIAKKKVKKDLKQKSHHLSDKHKKQSKYQKFDYKQLGIDNPENFDYLNHQNDWCRYCGARYSSNFTKGPWGPRTLCTIHYIDWNQKKKLNLSSYKQMPTNPINYNENTELGYLNTMKQKNPDMDMKKYILEQQKSKKLKLEEVIVEEKL